MTSMGRSPSNATTTAETLSMRVKIAGSMVDLLGRIDLALSSQCAIMIKTKGKQVMCAKADKATQLFWKSSQQKQLAAWGFEENACNPHNMNEMIDGHQATIAWHADDLKILHAEKSAV